MHTVPLSLFPLSLPLSSFLSPSFSISPTFSLFFASFVFLSPPFVSLLPRFPSPSTFALLVFLLFVFVRERTTYDLKMMSMHDTNDQGGIGNPFLAYYRGSLITIMVRLFPRRAFLLPGPFRVDWLSRSAL